jgi:hypothetical protein
MVCVVCEDANERQPSVAQDWMNELYKENSPDYAAWVKKEQTTLGVDEILGHLSLRSCLRTFMKTEYNAENVNFLDQVLLYRTISTQATRTEKACEIWKNYVTPGAPNQINLGAVSDLSALRPALEQCDRPGPYTAIPATIFDDTEKSIISLMRYDVFPRFRASPTYVDCVGKTMVEKQIRNFPAILAAFCADEEKAYAGRDQAKKLLIQAKIRANWNAKCKTDNTFEPPPPVRNRS